MSSMKVLILDNFDSFTYNLYQAVGEILQSRLQNFAVEVYRNSAIGLKEIAAKNYQRVIISPGPGSPVDQRYFGVCARVLLEISPKVPTLGVCLGMQGIAHYYGGRVVRAKLPMHGKTSKINHNGRGIFADLPQNLEVMRYHSLVVTNLPKNLIITAKVAGRAGKEIMGLRHKIFPIFGVQFHPESFATEGGRRMLENFLRGEKSAA